MHARRAHLEELACARLFWVHIIDVCAVFRVVRREDLGVGGARAARVLRAVHARRRGLATHGREVLRRLLAVEERGGLFERAAARLDDVGHYEDELDDKPAAVN